MNGKKKLANLVMNMKWSAMIVLFSKENHYWGKTANYDKLPTDDILKLNLLFLTFSLKKIEFVLNFSNLFDVKVYNFFERIKNGYCTLKDV